MGKPEKGIENALRFLLLNAMAAKIQDKSVEIRSQRLAGKRIALGVCGGIGSVEVIKIIREIRRHGGQVTAFMTPSAAKFITPLSLEWATTAPVVVDESADVEHLGEFDALIVAPATLNSISKAALGLADNAVATLIASHLGTKKPLLFVPTMNEQMQKHPRYEEYEKTLTSWGAEFFPSPVEEDRLKMPSPSALVEWLVKVLPKDESGNTNHN